MGTILGKIWQAWKKFGKFMGDWVARIVLSVFYGVIVLPFGVGARLFSDALRLKAEDDQSTLWLARESHSESLDDAQRQF